MLAGMGGAGPDKAALLKALQQKATASSIPKGSLPNSVSQPGDVFPNSPVGQPEGTITGSGQNAIDQEYANARNSPQILGAHPDSVYPEDRQWQPTPDALQTVASANGSSMTAFQSDDPALSAKRGWAQDTIDNVLNRRGDTEYVSLGTPQDWSMFLQDQNTDGPGQQWLDSSGAQDYSTPAQAFYAAQNADMSPEYAALAQLIQTYLDGGGDQGRGQWHVINDSVGEQVPLNGLFPKGQ